MVETQTVLWTRQDTPGTEFCALHYRRNQWQLNGTVVAALDGLPLTVRYRITCDRDWHTRKVTVAQKAGAESRLVALERLPGGTWRQGHLDLPHLRECTDIDLSITPATNTVAIRRLGLEIGQHADLTVAWLRFPSCELAPLSQRYTRTGDRTYLYESWRDGASAGFRAELTVDAAGLVTTYPGLWQQVAAYPSHR